MRDSLTRDIWGSLGGPSQILDLLDFSSSDGVLPSAFPVTDFAAASIGAAALSVAELIGQAFPAPRVTVDPRLASYWFQSSIRPVGWQMPAAWDSIAGDYRTTDGWIRLHTNAPHHRAAAQHVLGRHDDKASMAKAVAAWNADALERAIVEAGGCAAEMRSAREWAMHPQGQAVAAEPLIHISTNLAERPVRQPDATRPLAGLRVLDLTRVLAGPVASRFLAGYGADVLRIDPPDWDEPGVLPEVTLGKRCARLDLRETAGRRIFEDLLAHADILLHGYRPGALDGLGYDAKARRALSPALIDVSLCAYGWTGPWAGRRGFDSLMQMSTGIAQAGMTWKGADAPVPLPVQALDHTTGYLMAAAAIRGVTRRLASGEAVTARLSLARTAKLLTELGEQKRTRELAGLADEDIDAAIEHSDWGEARRLKPPALIVGAPMRWAFPARSLGTAEPVWQ